MTLNNIIQKNFPEEYAERKSEHVCLTNFGVDLIPLFVMDAVIPCQKFPLHIFEPRYRLMVIWLFLCLDNTRYLILPDIMQDFSALLFWFLILVLLYSLKDILFSHLSLVKFFINSQVPSTVGLESCASTF